MTTMLTPSLKEMDICFCADFKMELEYHYWPAVPGNRSGHPDTWGPDEPEELDIVSAKLVAPNGKDSVDLLPFLSGEQVDELYADLLDELRNYP